MPISQPDPIIMIRPTNKCNSFLSNENDREKKRKNTDWKESAAKLGCPRNSGSVSGRNDAWFAQVEVRLGWWIMDPCCPGSDNSLFDFCKNCKMNPGADFCIQSSPLLINETYFVDGETRYEQTTISNQCCYDINGMLLTNSFKGAGTVKRSVNNDDHLFSFFMAEFSFFMSCCEDEHKCRKYYAKRPTLIGQYSPPRRVINTGDPHFQSLDGFKYTFNGLGVYTMFEVSKSDQYQTSDLTMQISTRRIGNGTVFSGFVVSDNSTSAELFQLADTGKVSISINGTKLPFDQNSRVVETEACISREVFIIPKRMKFSYEEKLLTNFHFELLNEFL